MMLSSRYYRKEVTHKITIMVSTSLGIFLAKQVSIGAQELWIFPCPRISIHSASKIKYSRNEITHYSVITTTGLGIFLAKQVSIGAQVALPEDFHSIQHVLT